MPAPSLLANLLVFGRLLRRHGLDVHMGRLLDLAHALQHVDLGSREDVHATCRTLLIHRHEDFATFDRVFAMFWQGLSRPSAAEPSPSKADAPGVRSSESALGAQGTEGGELDIALRTWSDSERLGTKDFAELTEEELVLARSAIERIAWQPRERRTRRWVRGRGPRIDMARARSASLSTGGDLVRLPRRRRRTRPRPLVLICDVSGSMERYSRTLLHFAHALWRRTHRVEAFLFSTRLTRITPALRASRADAALEAAARAVHDWSGGTRIGEALRTFHQRWRRRVLHGGPVVLLISDGWDLGEPHLLREEIARLQRSCHRLIWLNPLVGSADFAPLTRGLEAALPFVDDFLPVRTLGDVRDLATHLAKLTGR